MKEKFEAFYNDHLKKFGSTAQGVGWKNIDAQRIRFQQLCKIINPPAKRFSINDLGCGVGNLIDFLNEGHEEFSYHGYDVMDEMIQNATSRYRHLTRATFKVIQSAAEMKVADYTVSSGIFNIRFDCDDTTWLDYVLQTLSQMNEKSNEGFAFNMLTKYSDRELMKNELYYADPAFLFDHCKRNFSRNVALLHDYDLYDFTILVRKRV